MPSPTWTWDATPFVTQASQSPSRSITVPSGTQAVFFLYSAETSGSGTPVVTAVGDGVQSAVALTGAALSGGAGPRLLSDVWYIVNPTIGTSTWTVTAVGSGVVDATLGIAFVSDLDTADPFCHVAIYANAATTATARDATLVTDANDALFVSHIVGRDLGDTFTWDLGTASTEPFTATATEVSVATKLAPLLGAQSLGGDWSANPTRSNMIGFALNYAASAGGGGGGVYYRRRRSTTTGGRGL